MSTFDLEIQQLGVYRLSLSRIGDLPSPPPPPVPPPPPPPVPPSGTFLDGSLPVDGFKGVVDSPAYWLRPKVTDGQRLSGVVTIGVQGVAPPVALSYRLLVDGEPQLSMTIDTKQWCDGTHVLAIQFLESGTLSSSSLGNGSKVVVFNNSGVPQTSLTGQAVVTQSWDQGPSNRRAVGNSLAWGRVDISAAKARPPDLQLDRHPPAVTDADRARLATEKIWWVDGFSHQPTPLWGCMPIMMKNKDGDYFIKSFNPEGGESGVQPLAAQPYVQRAPAYDGSRGLGFLGPYASLVPHPRVLASGQTGWIGVEKSGRVLWVDVDGTVETILGPCSVAGVVGTDCDEMSVTLEMRLANGEKEYVGNHNGKPLNLPHDVWVSASFPFEGVIADTGNNRVAEIQFYDRVKPDGTVTQGHRLMRSWPLSGVTSVWSSYDFENDAAANVIWFAVNPEGLWVQRHLVGSDGRFVGHDPVLVKLADIPKAFWVRGHGHRVYVLTTDLGLYEYDFATGSLTQRKPREPAAEFYAFMAVDENGSIGPKGRIYWGCPGTTNSSARKTTLGWLDTSDWSSGVVTRERLLNRVIYGNWTALDDPLGHYEWGMAIHPTLPMFLVCGITSSSWFRWTGCLGPRPVPDPAITNAGYAEWRYGKIDEYLGLGAIFGQHGHGMIGYAADDFCDYKTWEEARAPMRAAVDPLFPASMPEADRENVARQLFAQRTRRHYQ